MLERITDNLIKDLDGLTFGPPGLPNPCEVVGA